jgi:hypothetical protein
MASRPQQHVISFIRSPISRLKPYRRRRRIAQYKRMTGHVAEIPVKRYHVDLTVSAGFFQHTAQMGADLHFAKK